MNARALTKRKSETNVVGDYPPHNNKRLLTERIAAGMGVLRLNDTAQDAQGNTRPPFVRTSSTPSAFYNGPAFTPSRPDLVSSFELSRPQGQSMDQDFDMACDTPPSQHNASQLQAVTSSIYSQQHSHLLNTAPKFMNAIIPVSECKDAHPLYPIVEEEEQEETPTLFKLNIPKLPEPMLDIPFLHNLTANPESRALILYTPPKAVIEESLVRNRMAKEKEKVMTNEQGPSEALTSTLDQDVMMLD